METAEARSERIKRVTEKAWYTFPMRLNLAQYLPDVQDAFFEEAKKQANAEFWSGDWCDLPMDESGQEYWLHQFWGTYYDEILEVAEKVVVEE